MLPGAADSGPEAVASGLANMVGDVGGRFSAFAGFRISHRSLLVDLSAHETLAA